VPVLVTGAFVSAVLTAFEAQDAYEQVEVQRGIDAHAVKVIAPLVQSSPSQGFESAKHILRYRSAGREVLVRLRSIPPGAEVGDEFCLEVNVERPGDARLCGTRGNLPDARQSALTGGAFTVGFGGLAVLFLVWGRRRATRMAAEWVEAEAAGPEALVRGQVLDLRPAPVTRVTLVTLSFGVPAILGLTMFADPTMNARLWAPMFLAVGAVAGWRAGQLGIRCADGTVSVGGPLRTHRIPAAAVTNVIPGDVPRLFWKDPTGAVRSTRLSGFWQSERLALEGVYRHNSSQMDRLRAWLAVNR
jgi:hypothetical protein